MVGLSTSTLKSSIPETVSIAAEVEPKDVTSSNSVLRKRLEDKTVEKGRMVMVVMVWLNFQVTMVIRQKSTWSRVRMIIAQNESRSRTLQYSTLYTTPSFRGRHFFCRQFAIYIPALLSLRQ